MSYTKHIFQRGERLLASQLNEMEDQIAQNTEDIAEASTCIHDTASGDVASFSDGADGKPLKSLSVTIEPVQDLHGYDHPWPAGARNRINPSAVSDTNVYIDHGTGNTSSPSSNVEWRTTDYIPVTQGEVLYFGEVNAPASLAGSAFYDSSKNYVSGFTATQLANENNVWTVPSGAAYLRHAFRVDEGYNTNWETTVYIVLNSDAHEWVPYSNICQITVLTECNLTRTGINIWDEEWEVGGINPNNGEKVGAGNAIRTKNFIPVTPQTNYYIKHSGVVIVCGYNKDKQFVKNVLYNQGNRAFSTSDDRIRYIRAQFSNYGTVYNNDLCINYPAIDTLYQVYTGTTIPMIFMDSQGNLLNVYKGTLDIVSGHLTANWVTLDLSAISSWAISSTNPSQHNAVISGIKENTNNIISEKYANDPSNRQSASNMPYGKMVVYTNKVYITSGENVNPNGIIAYELATPIEYQLTPQEVTTILGQNNIWADTGSVSVEYQADTKLYIDRKISEAVAALNS